MTLARLIEAVEAGTLKNIDLVILEPEEHANAWSAFHGSLDAAKRLHDALLPGWWAMLRHSTRPCVTVGYVDAVQEALDEDLARAWLLAVLRAMEVLDG